MPYSALQSSRPQRTANPICFRNLSMTMLAMRYFGVQHGCVVVALNVPVGRDELIRKRRRSRVHTVTAQGTKTAARNADSDEEWMSDFRLVARYRPILCKSKYSTERN